MVIKKKKSKVEAIDSLNTPLFKLPKPTSKLLKEVGLKLLEKKSRSKKLREMFLGSTGGDPQMISEIKKMSLEDLYDHFSGSYVKSYSDFLNIIGVSD